MRSSELVQTCYVCNHGREYNHGIPIYHCAFNKPDVSLYHPVRVNYTEQYRVYAVNNYIHLQLEHLENHVRTYENTLEPEYMYLVLMVFA
jgi:hypothetical protein